MSELKLKKWNEMDEDLEDEEEKKEDEEDGVDDDF